MNNIGYFTYIVKIYYDFVVTHFLTHNELFRENKTALKYQHTLVDIHVLF